MIIAIDKGHILGGGSFGHFAETDANRVLGDKVIGLLRGKGHTVYDVTVDNGPSSTELARRVALANSYKTDIYVSLHFNAYIPEKATGTETYLAPYNTQNYSSKAVYDNNYAIAKRVNDKIVGVLGLPNRGVKTESFAVLVGTINTKASILIEPCFLDTKGDATKYLANIDNVARAICEGITGESFAVAKPPVVTPPAPTATMYRVVTGSFGEKSYADNRLADLKKAGFESFIDKVTINNKAMYRVVTGSFGQKANADARLTVLKKAGFESFIDKVKK